MTIFRPLPRSLTRPLAYLTLVAWVVCMGLLVNRSYLQAQASNLATDLARYGPTAMWRGVYYRGEKIGFSVSQTVRTDEGFELQEDGRLQMLLLGQDSIAALRTTARVDRDFQLLSFDFSLDPGTGAVQVQGTLDGPRPDGQFTLRVAITSSGRTRTEDRVLTERPALSLNMARQLASSGLTPGARHRWMVLDPATLQNAPMEFLVGRREVVRTSDGVVPAFRVDMTFAGLATTAWVTDTGDVVREESPLGLMTIRETPERAQALGIPGRVQRDLLQASAVVPEMRQRLDEPRDVRRLRLRLVGADLTSPDLNGVGQTVDGDVIEIRDPQSLQPGPADPEAANYLAPEPLLESDDPEIVAEAAKAVQGVTGTRERAEALTRYVNALLEKKPTISLPSAREVLRTKVGDCNEHTALYVAMARALGIPARISVGLVFVRGAQGAFYYHAWPEVYIDAGGGRGYWLPVDPTFNQFPADSTHLRLARGGLDKQAAILPLIGRLRMTVLEMDVIPTSAAAVAPTPQQGSFAPLPVVVPRRNAAGCECEDY
jgi:transglutaminase-like putative cysteine protease